MSGQRPGRIELASLILVAWVLISASQYFTGIFSREFTGNPDEASHFTTGLMIRDYAASGLAQHPMRFAERFYLSYPKVAFGIWPPLFHLVEGAWMLVFPVSRTGVMLLMGLLGALLAAISYAWSAREFGRGAALSCVALLMAAPGFRHMVSYVNADLLCTVLMTAAAYCFCQFVETESWKDSAAFGVLAGLALLTKYNAGALALFPVLVVLLTGRFGLLRKWQFWLPAPFVLGMIAPWYVVFWKNVSYAAAPGPDNQPSVWLALTGNLGTIWITSGMVTAAAAIVGAVLLLQTRTVSNLWRSLIALFLSVTIFHTFLYPITEIRYLTACLLLPSLLAAWALNHLLPATGNRLSQHGPQLALAAVVICALWQGPMLERPLADGLQQAARTVLDGFKRADGNGVVLVTADVFDEGGFIAEMALKESRPGSFVLRGSKTLARSTWMSDHYQLRFTNTQAVEQRLDELRVKFLVIGTSGNVLPHQKLLAETVAQTSHWCHRFTSEQGLQVWERTAPFTMPAKAVVADLSYSLGRSIEAPNTLGNAGERADVGSN